jgi:hypothetical protein
MSHASRTKAAAAAMARVRPLLVVPEGWRSHHASSTGDLFMLDSTRQVSISLLSWSVLHTWRSATGESSRYTRFREGDVAGVAARANEELAAEVATLTADRPSALHSTPVACPK